MKSPVQIRRTTTLAEGSQLLEGELGYSYDSDKLFIGGAGAASNVEVGGASFLALLSATPGTATADKAVILDSNTKIDVWTVAGLVEADTFKTSASVNAGFVKNDGLGNLLFGQTGEQTDFFLDNLADVDTTNVAPGKHLIFDGTNWVPVANDLIGLADTPPDYSGAANLYLRVDPTASFVEFVSIGLSDLPAIDLDDLDDADVSSPNDSDVLTFNSTSENWEAVALASGVSALDDLSDVTLSGPVDFGHLEYDGIGQWKNVQDLTINAGANDAQLNFNHPIPSSGWNFRTSANRLLISRGLPIGNIALALNGNTSGSSDIFELDSSVTGEITMRPAPFLGSNSVSTDVDVHFETRGTGQFFFDAAGAGNVVSNNGYESSDTGAYYLGDPLTNGSWRIMRDIGGTEDLLIQERILSSWVTKGSFTT